MIANSSQRNFIGLASRYEELKFRENNPYMTAIRMTDDETETHILLSVRQNAAVHDERNKEPLRFAQHTRPFGMSCTSSHGPPQINQEFIRPYSVSNFLCRDERKDA